MSLFVVSLVILAAGLHVLWNTLVKSCSDKVSFAWLTSLAGTLLLLPVFIFCRFLQPGALTREVWAWAALSGLFEALYVIFLFTAYGKADLSMVYPLSRGFAPLVTLMLGGMLLGDAVSLEQSLVIGVIIVGVVCVGFSNRHLDMRRLDLTGILFSLATGCMIAGYHLVDRRAMSLPAAPSPAEYLFLMHLFLAGFITLWACWGVKRRSGILSEWLTNRKSVLIVGVCTPLAYFLIVVALRYGNVTHVAAGRNIGIFFSTLVGALVLREKVTGIRIIGALLIAAGVAGLVVFADHA